MKIFVSWSGEFSQKVAEIIKKWIPCIINEVDVFYSKEDIEKGENWDIKLTKELAECKFGIVCLSPDNISAPWIHFEAGAIAKALNSRVATLLIGINPSDIKGPLSRYQATKIEKEDFFQLIESINSQCDTPLQTETINITFNALWDSIAKDISDITIDLADPVGEKKKNGLNEEIVEEILQLLRKQNTILLSPEQLLPPDYFQYLYGIVQKSRKGSKRKDIIDDLISYCSWAISKAEENEEQRMALRTIDFEALIDIIYTYSKASSTSDENTFLICRRLCNRAAELLF